MSIENRGKGAPIMILLSFDYGTKMQKFDFIYI